LDNAADYWENERITKGWALRTSVDIGNNFDDLSRVGGQVFLDTNYNRLGVLANVNWYREHNSFGKDPSALMSDVNLTYRLTQCEWLQMHVGLGARMWNSIGDVSGGVNGFYRGDLFPFSPVNLSTIYEIGNLDQSLHKVLTYPFGQVLLVLIAAGFICYGLFCFARARHLST
jgi:hypothetical protein